MKIEFSVNGAPRTLEAHPMERLLDVLREQLHLTGTKEGCGEGECGACSVVINGRIVNSCLVPVAQVAGATIKTIEGVANGDQLHAVQQAFIDCGGAPNRPLHPRHGVEGMECAGTDTPATGGRRS